MACVVPFSPAAGGNVREGRHASTIKTATTGMTNIAGRSLLHPSSIERTSSGLDSSHPALAHLEHLVLSRYEAKIDVGYRAAVDPYRALAHQAARLAGRRREL